MRQVSRGVRRIDFSGDSAAVETYKLCKKYGKTTAVLDLTLRVDPGEVFGFLGPNGAGKTTAIKMLMGLVSPTAGSALIMGKPLGNSEVKRKIGFLPEDFRFHEWLRADEFLNFHAQLCGMTREERESSIPEVLQMMGLSARAKDKLHTFSKGMLQRIGLAQALVHHPSLVFLDEPTSGLDPIGRREVRDIIRDLRDKGVTVFLNSHLLSEIEMVCDRVAIIDKGLVVSQGELESLLGQDLEVELRVEHFSSAMFMELMNLASGISVEMSSARLELDRQEVRAISDLEKPEAGLPVGEMSPELLDQLSDLCNSLSADGVTLTLHISDIEEIPRIAEVVVSNGGRIHALIPKHLSLEELFVRVVGRGSKV